MSKEGDGGAGCLHLQAPPAELSACARWGWQPPATATNRSQGEGEEEGEEEEEEENEERRTKRVPSVSHWWCGQLLSLLGWLVSLLRGGANERPTRYRNHIACIWCFSGTVVPLEVLVLVVLCANAQTTSALLPMPGGRRQQQPAGRETNGRVVLDSSNTDISMPTDTREHNELE